MNLSPLQLSLVRLLGKKDLTFGCLVKLEDGCVVVFTDSETSWYESEGRMYCDYNGDSCGYNKSFRFEIIGHPVTISDFHGWLVDKCLIFEQRALSLVVKDLEMNLLLEVSYLSNKKLLDQSEETLSAILNLVKSHAK